MLSIARPYSSPFPSAPPHCSAPEAALASFLKDVETALGLPLFSPALPEAQSGGKGEEKGESMPFAPPSFRRQRSSEVAVPPAEVHRALTRLMQALPELADRRWLHRSGLPLRAQKALAQRLGEGGGVDALLPMLLSFLDARAWRELQPLLDRLVKERRSFRWRVLVQEGHEEEAWFLAAVAVLGSPRVQFSRAGRAMAGFLGLSPILRVWELAQVWTTCMYVCMYVSSLWRILQH